MKIRTAHPSDLPAFSALWELAFQDGPEVSRFVFEKLVHPEHVYLAEEDAIPQIYPLKGEAGVQLYEGRLRIDLEKIDRAIDKFGSLPGMEKE